MRQGGKERKAAADPERRDAWQAAVKLLAMRAHSAQELRKRLARRGYPADEITSVIARLTALRYLDDAELAKTWARSRAQRRSLGPGRLARELRAKGIPDPQIRAALTEVFQEQTPRRLAERAVARKLPGLRGLAPAVAHRRLAGYLQRQGFAAEVILALCREHFPDLAGTEDA